MKKWIVRILCLIVLLSFCLPMTVLASAETLDPAKDASLTLVYQHEGQPFDGLEIKTYRVADVTDGYVFSLTGQFSSYPVSLDGIESQTEWNIICQTLQSYVWADSLTPTATATTDASGTVKFDKLLPGIYLTMPVSILAEAATTEFFGFLTVLPDEGTDWSLNYDVTAYPKSTQYNPNDDDVRMLKVVKQWKDPGYHLDRPDSVQVDIYRNGEFKATVSLSSENNWTHSWVAADDGAVWTAVERQVPEAYTVTIEYKDDTIILTNTRKGDDSPPNSGDTFVFWPYILGMCLSGCCITLLAVSKKKAKV